MDKPLVSVIITTYNRFDFLCRAIDSVLLQTYKNIEIIVVDDCSTLKIEKQINKYNEKIKYIRNQKNLGLSASRNIGIHNSSGEYLSFLDDDDELLPDKIKYQIKLLLSNQELKVTYCGSKRKNKDAVVDWQATLRGNIYPEVLMGTPNAIHTLMVHKDCLREVGLFDESFIGFEDYDLWVRLSRKYLFDYVPELLVIYNIHGLQMTANIYERITSIEQMLSKYEEDMLCYNKIYSDYLRKLASRYALVGDGNKFIKNIVAAIRFDKFNLGAYVHLILFFLCRPLHRKIIIRYGLLKVGDVTLA